MSNPSSTCRFKNKNRKDKKQINCLVLEEGKSALAGTVNNKQKKWRLAMEFLTPVWNYRAKKSDSSSPVSPILLPPLLSFSDGSFELQKSGYKDGHANGSQKPLIIGLSSVY